ncbi:MAG: zinc ribbon domain-containing protein [Gemmatimonadaceae bacterium]|nr:zinc ribbon domain-containing protein [Gemmatimonadaceae bacterium]MCW5827175.1 zinc ribbon domain-containing protein [Gemmatimonadaceae bacterium]
MPADALAALFRRLVLAAQQADALARPLEVGEILDTLVPYRAARRDGLLDTNDDYLHAMMRLLAGEGGFVFADDLLQDDLKSELTTSNPDLMVLRSYHSAKVRLATARIQEVLAGDTAIDLRPPTPVATDIVPPVAPAPDPGVPTTESPASVCPYCSRDLPDDRTLKYCPHCGLNLRIRRCPGCSAEMESEWKFCVTCGRSAA